MSSIEVLEAAIDAFCIESRDGLTAADALTLMARLEVVQRRLSAHGLGLVPKVTAQASPVCTSARRLPAAASLTPNSWCPGVR
ncbi:hypothetical protein [Mycobacteroides salmoniphilum]|uniref:hypothetical protein n=1 Tax=Mycobacteroides salmoniphilum TaxID=404941 RepID=UPI003B8A6D3C